MMDVRQTLFHGMKRLLRPLRLDRFALLREIDRRASIALHIQDEYLTVTANIAAGLLRRGAVALDVGANKGIVSRAMLKAVGPTGVVHAFEPNPHLAQKLQRINGLVVHPIALGCECTRSQLFIPARNDTIASLSYSAVVSSATDAELRRVTTENVEVKTLDSFNLEQVHMLKVDAQGAELDVLLGAEETIRRCHPIILAEIWPDGLREFGETDQSVMAFLCRMEYAFIRFGGGPTWWDVLAIPSELTDVRNGELI